MTVIPHSYFQLALLLIFTQLLHLSEPGWSPLILLIGRLRGEELTFLAPSYEQVIGRRTPDSQAA